MFSTVLKIICCAVAMGAYTWTIYIICKKIEYIEIILHQNDHMLQLLQFQIDLVDANMYNDYKMMKKVKDEYTQYCIENGLSETIKVNKDIVKETNNVEEEK